LDDTLAPAVPADRSEEPDEEMPPADPALPEAARHSADGRPNRLRRTFVPLVGRERLPVLEWRVWRRRGTAAVFALALILGFGGAAPLASSPKPVASANPVAAGSADPSPSVAAVASPTPAPSADATVTPTTAGTAMAIPSQTSPIARIAFTAVMLDSTTDPAASPRTFTFVSDGPGMVSAHVVGTSPTETTRLCIAADGAPPDCSSGAMPGFTKPVFTAHSNWTVTLVSAGSRTPTVDVAFSWPAAHPSVHLEGGRFQGAPNPDSIRSLVATFTTRAAGRLSLTAAWPPASVDATLALADASGPQPAVVATVAYPAAVSIAPAYGHTLAAGRTYTVTLYDAGSNMGRPNLSATIAFP
jgi:hypothetical protein